MNLYNSIVLYKIETPVLCIFKVISDRNIKDNSISYPLLSILNLAPSWYNAYTGG